MISGMWLSACCFPSSPLSAVITSKESEKDSAMYFCISSLSSTISKIGLPLSTVGSEVFSEIVA